MDKLIISGEGFPGTNEFIQFQHDTPMKAIEGMAKAFGNNVIVSGMYVLAMVGEEGIVGSGWLTRNGELLPFVGGSPSQETIAIIEETTEAGYDTQGTGDFANVQPVWRKRWCRFGTMATPGAVAVFPYSVLTRVPTLEGLNSRLRFLKKGSLTIDDVVLYGTPGATVTGNFTNVEIITSVFSARVVKISFTAISGDYFPLVLRNNQTAEIGEMPYNLLEKTSTSITLLLRRDVEVQNWYELTSQELMIYLIG